MSSAIEVPRARRLWPALLPLAVLALLVVFAVSWFVGRGLRFGPRYGMVLQSPEPAKDFRLMSHQGQYVSLSDFRGDVVLLYFGYTTCPDVCPNTLADVHRAMQLLGSQADQVHLLMISVDPDRDTARVLADYMTHFDPRFIGLVGTPEQVAEVATHYGIFYERQKTDSALGYLVDHTATLLLIDRGGYTRLVFPYKTKPEELASDIRYVLGR